MKVLVTGGSGFLGRNLKKHRPDWIYVSSRDYDLTKEYYTRGMFYEIKPDAVIHLAGKVGGIKDNVQKQAEYYVENVKINTNVVETARETGVNRLLASLSTCAFPNIVRSYPFKEEDMFSGPPATTNFSYGMAKRGLHTHCMAIRKQHGYNYSTFSPSNIYGPGDYFGKDSSHFIASLVYKIANAKDGDEMEFWGTGNPKRQQLYIDDLCQIIPILLEKHNSDIPLIVAPDQNLSIRDMVLDALFTVGKNNKFVFNGSYDGQYRKDGSNKRLKEIIDFKFTTFSDGFKKTYDSYLGGNSE